ncbi:ABC transporter ATP-binding protein [Fundicoccus sp. Sow4_H7]|uniref:ABC transporter ATP-binding protein n=1 Tax=Fundicoccus sp. Sow4_H7 TaxID=3438784 RepID=UPI003F92AD7F
MKKKWSNFILLLKEITSYSKTIWVWMTVNVLVKTILPLSRIVLSAMIIEWLIEGIHIEQFLFQLAIGIAIVCLLELVDEGLLFYFESERDRFRLGIGTKISGQILYLDFPNIQSEEGQEKYTSALGLAGSPAALFGRIITDLMELSSAVFSAFLYASLIFQVDRLFLIIIAVMIIGLLIFNVLQKRVNERINLKKSANNRQNSYLRRLYGDLRLAKDIRLYQMMDWFMEIKQGISAAYIDIMRPKNRLIFFENIYLSIGTIILTSFAYITSIQEFETGALNVSGFVVYVGAITLLASTITVLINHVSILDQDLEEVQYYADFMNQPAVFNHGKGQVLPTDDISVEFRNVSYTYSSKSEMALENISFTFNPREKLAIVGENGAGKTTLIKLMSGLIKPDSGEILINGIKQEQFNIEEYYELFSTVFQDNYLLTYSIKDTIIQGMPFEEDRYRKVLEQSGVEKFLNQFKDGDETKIVKDVDQDAVQLSGGQLQKLKLAQALYKDAPILILDEPTDALDPISEHEVYQDYLTFSQNRLSLFISHRLASTRFCDRILYLREGKVTEVGSHNELMALKGDYYNLYEAQAYYYRNNTELKAEMEELEIEVGGVI